MSIAVITGASSGLGVCYIDAVTKLFPEIDELWLIARREERLKANNPQIEVLINDAGMSATYHRQRYNFGSILNFCICSEHKLNCLLCIKILCIRTFSWTA